MKGQEGVAIFIPYVSFHASKHHSLDSADLFMEKQTSAANVTLNLYLHVQRKPIFTNISLATVVGVSLRSNMTGTEVDTNGQIRSPKETSKHGTRLLAADQTWEDCNPAQSHQEEKAAESLDSRGKAKKTKKQREGWSTGGKQALPVTRASRLMPSDRGKEKKSRNRTQYRGNYLKDNTDGKGKKEAEREKKGQGIVEKGKDVSKKWEERKDVDEEWQIKCKERGCGVKNGKMQGSTGKG